MVHTCVAVGCSNRKESGSSISFYRFPRDVELRQKWIQAVKRREDWVPNEGSRLCSQHFIAGKHSKNALSPDYVPSIFGHTSSPEKKRRKMDLEAFDNRIIAIRNNAEIENAANTLLHFKHKMLKIRMDQKRKERTSKRDQKRKEVAAKTLLNLHKSSANRHLNKDAHAVDSAYVETECRRPMERNYKRTETVEKLSVSENSFRDNDRVKFYTGLPTLKLLQFVL